MNDSIELVNLLNDNEGDNQNCCFDSNYFIYQNFKEQFEFDEDNGFYKKCKKTCETDNYEIANNQVNEDINKNVNTEIVIYSKENINEKNQNINVKQKLKRGRINKKGKKTFECYYYKKPYSHNKYKPDNIRIKIKSHYHNFIIAFFNEFIRCHFNIQRYKLRKIDYNITKDVTMKYNSQLMNMKLYEFLSQKVSTKYNCPQDMNRQIINNLLHILKKKDKIVLLNMSYWDFYTHVYLSHEKKNIFDKFGLKIKNESKLAFFDDLINNINDTIYKNAVADLGTNHFIQNYMKNTFKFIVKKEDNFNKEELLKKKRKLFIDEEK